MSLRPLGPSAARADKMGACLPAMGVRLRRIHETSGLNLTIVEESVIDLLSLFESPGQFHVPQGSKIPLEFIDV